MTYLSNRRIFLATMAALPLSACDPIGTDTAEWEEEVKLHDGQFITLRRKAACNSSGFPDAKRGSNIYFSIEYTALKVYWKGSWDRWPISFELFDGVPHLAAFIMGKSGCAGKASTAYAAEFFRFEHGQWKIISQSEYPTTKALMNLYINFWGYSHKDDPSGLIPWRSTRHGDDFDPDRPMTIDLYFSKYRDFCKYV